MEILSLTEKAQTYSRKFTPVVKSRFVEVEAILSRQKTETDAVYINQNTKKKPRIFMGLFIFLMIMCMSFFGFKMLILKNDTVGVELSSVIGRLFLPKDFGKIKFVDLTADELESEAFSSLNSLELPFRACTSSLVGETFLLSSPSEILVKCAMDGVVESVVTDEKTFKKTVTVAHKHDLKTIYYMLDNVSVKVGDKVEKNMPIAIVFDCVIGFKISYKNSIVKGLEIIDGELSFS